MTGIEVPRDQLRLHERARRIGDLFDAIPATGALRPRICDLIAHVVAAHAVALERILTLADRPDVVEGDAELGEILWVHRPAVHSPDAVDRYGNQIESLLAAIEQSASPDDAELAARLAGEVGDLYGEALERTFELLHETGQGDAIRAALDDDLVSSLLVVHDLHPKDLGQRVADCLAELVDTLPEHGGLVDLLDIDPVGLVTIEITGGSELHRWRTRLAVERAIDHAAPDHGGIEVRGADAEPSSASITTFIPLDQVRRSAPSRLPRRWVDLPALAELTDGAVGRLTSDDVSVIACNVDGDLYVVVDPFERDELNGFELTHRSPPTIAAADGRQLVFTAPLPVQRTDGTVEVKVP